jgi:hypothetical protein
MPSGYRIGGSSTRNALHHVVGTELLQTVGCDYLGILKFRSEEAAHFT